MIFICQIEIPDGTYEIDIVFGDPDNTDQTNHVQVENVSLNDPDGPDNFDAHTDVIVTVSDGKLTVSPMGTSGNAKICYIDIVVAN